MQSVTEKTSIDDSMFGGNASAEGADEGGADGDVATHGINVILSHRLVETGFNKKSYQTYLKGYMKAIKAKLEETNPSRVDTFVKGAQAMAKMILGKFDQYQFYTGESMNPEGMAILLNYREDGVTPYFIFMKDGLLEEKF